MRRFSNIDNVFMLKHELTLQESYILEWVLHLPIWADKSILSDKTIYFASKNKACQDLPMITKQNDTMQRYYRRLEEKGMIKLFKVSNKDYIEILPKCAEWNSVIKTTDQTEDHDGFDGKDTSKRPTNSIISSNSILNSTLFDQEKIPTIPKDVIQYLNDSKPGKTPFQMSSTNLGLVKARIKDGFNLDDFKIVILHKIKEWKGKEKTKKWIRPATLFGTKFETYVVQARDATTSDDGSGNFAFEPMEKAQLT